MNYKLNCECNRNTNLAEVGMYDGYYDEFEREFVLKGLVKRADHYLIMAHNCRWNGSSGYNIVGDIKDTIYRDYDVCIYPVAVSGGGKCLVCREHSHDVPMGAQTSIIALTDKEYEKLSAWYTEWDEVAKFAEKVESSVKVA